ncbi:hypothetical protein BKA00_007310 [Actinomadura coerulea]|uniref:Uncharacterized protein n=1 Tax=Actinomadura coerulea TaxID=46159 RepID=A0A7X0L338_9ACTN|nr:hypothetical protein [Actinomadura coerulea]MBB6400396.1 hypothetical protein [Actinomadura coerulea]
MAFLPPSQQPPPPRSPHRPGTPGGFRPPGPPGPHANPVPGLARPFRAPPRPVDAGGPPTVMGLTGRQWMVAALVLGCCYLVATGISFVGTWTTLKREPTNAELQIAANKEVARRWEAWPARRVFPERLGYRPTGNHTEYATRTGIVPDAGCVQGVDEEIATTIARHGCRAVLRATYVDQLQGVVVTVGVVAFPDPWKADRAYKELPGSQGPDGTGSVRPALHAAAFPGTASARFTDEARQDRTIDRGGPYVVLTTSGQADGRPASTIKKQRPGEPFAVSPQIAHAIARALSAKALPDCDQPEWRC